jgi:hypothetical protein
MKNELIEYQKLRESYNTHKEFEKLNISLKKILRKTNLRLERKKLFYIKCEFVKSALSE